MTTPAPSLLHVTEQAHGELRPRAATLHVTLTAFRFFSGGAALAKSEELRKLVDALVACGVPETAVSLAGASLDVSTGLFSRSSSVTYRVRVHVTELDLLASVLEAISSAKQATLDRIAWDHGHDGPDGVDQLLAECAARAAAKARRLAAALGATLDGIHEVHEEQLGDSAPRPFDDDVRMARVVACAKARARSSIDHELAGLELAPPRPITVLVRVAYRLSSGSTPAT
jgi:uncharacterized protein YggE